MELRKKCLIHITVVSEAERFLPCYHPSFLHLKGPPGEIGLLGPIGPPGLKVCLNCLKYEIILNIKNYNFIFISQGNPGLQGLEGRRGHKGEQVSYAFLFALFLTSSELLINWLISTGRCWSCWSPWATRLSWSSCTLHWNSVAWNIFLKYLKFSFICLCYRAPEERRWESVYFYFLYLDRHILGSCWTWWRYRFESIFIRY